jgi:hypothetical protein
MHSAYNTQSIFCTSNPYVYMGLQWVMTRHFTPYYDRLYTTLYFHALLFWTCITFGGRDKLILSIVLACIGERTVPIAWCDCSRDICVLVVQMVLVKCYIWSIALFGAETWTLQAVDQKYLKRFEMWCWRRMEKISWTEHVRNEAVRIT